MSNKDGEVGYSEARIQRDDQRFAAMRLQDGLSLRMGAGIVDSELLIEKGAMVEDVRVRIKRTESGTEVSLHGIAEGEEWTPPSAPRLIISYDAQRQIASIHLVSQTAAERQVLLIDQMNLSA
jgi:hypothetical protein